MATLPRLRLKKVIQFASGFAMDLLIPDAVEKVVKALRSFHQNFIVIDVAERVEMLRELEEVSPDAEAELIDALLSKWAEEIPGCPLPAETRQIAQRMVTSLRSAKAATESGQSADEAMRRSLNAILPQAKQLAAPVLDASQRSIGRLLMASRLQAADKPPVGLGVADAPVIQGYRMLRRLGAGGFGVVVLARHELTGTLRAVKFGPLTDPARFKQEIALASKLNNPHLVRYFESGEQGGRFWIAMEYLGDTTLADLMARPDFRSRPFMLPQLAEQLLEGVAALHAAGMIHRDLKPANVMVDEQFRLKLIDFGLAKPVEKLNGYASTKTGTILGTPFYMSPEQLRGEKSLLPAADVYSIATIIYEMFVGQPPHQAPSFAELAVHALTGAINFELPAIPTELHTVLKTCLNREVGGRYANGNEALTAYRNPAAECARRLRHEHYRPAWVPILKQQILEKFATSKRGVLVPDATEQFQRALSRAGFAECDGERLSEILPEIFQTQWERQMAEEVVASARQKFAEEVGRLTTHQMRDRTEEIARLETAVGAATARVTEVVRNLLANDVAAWDPVLDAERRTGSSVQTPAGNGPRVSQEQHGETEEVYEAEEIAEPCPGASRRPRWWGRLGSRLMSSLRNRPVTTVLVVCSITTFIALMLTIATIIIRSIIA